MSSGLYTHTTRATGTLLTAAIYNSDHQNHITNQNPTMTGGLSDNVGEMQATFDPGSIGSEVLAESLANELQALRFVIKRVLGAAQWYEDVGTMVTTGSTNIFTITQAIETDLVNLVLRRTENTVGERELVSFRSGDGSGDRASLLLAGNDENDLLSLRWLVGSLGFGLVPVGIWLPWGGDTLPKDWIWADGVAKSRTTFSRLFSVFGTKYGAGDGSTTFGIPNLKGRLTAGRDNLGGGSSANVITNAAADTVGGTMGSETHQLTEAELAEHSHRMFANDENGNLLTTGSHSVAITGFLGTSISNNYSMCRPSNATQTPTMGATSFIGSNTPHNNVQPTLFSDFIIYAGQS